ncbi:MAG: LacI family DNA-binding transcriptional regulator [Verrucomicrobia bacterium]|nr:LacI family DNA-binding transcriptional regulator [Verrucomicrobiota bacterium]
MPTIKDIARAAGVSYTTVSHVLNDSRPVSPKIKQSVQDAAKALNYVPSGVARALRRRTTGTIGMLLANTADPFFAQLVSEIEEVCFQNQVSLLLCNSYEDSVRQEAHIRSLLQKRVDGLLISAVGDFTALVELLRKVLVPVVFVDRIPPGFDADAVTVDQERAGYEATRHLLELGHRRIGCITGRSNISVLPPRVGGYRRALQEAGIKPHAHWIAEAVDLTLESGYAATEYLFNRSPGLTALFAVTDVLAIGTMRYAYQRNLSVPGALSIIGFDGVELGRYVLPALTSIAQPIRELGASAATYLLERIRGSRVGPGCRIVLPAKLIVRDSTGPAPL